MPEIPATAFFNFFIYLTIPFIFAYVAKYLKIPPVVGYMIGGVILGNLFGSLISKDVINEFAFFGIVLLLFAVGLETNFERMFALKRFIFIGGLLQILLSIVFIGAISLLFQFSLLQSILLGIALSASSTSLVAKIIQDRGEEGSFLGEIVMGILVFQDLALIPFIIIFNSFIGGDINFLTITKNIIIDIFIASIILWLMLYVGKRFVPLLFNVVAKVSRELLNFFIVIFILLVALITAFFKIPILIGMFVAGVLVAQTVEHHHIFSRIRPLRDMLAIIFFIYIGSNVSLIQVLPQIIPILGFALLVFIVKGLIIFSIFIGLRFSTRVSFYISLSLFQVSETAFILASIVLLHNVFNQNDYLFVVMVTLLGLLITPFLMNNKEKMYLNIRDFGKKYFPQLERHIKNKVNFSVSPVDALNIKNHAIICGYGRVGSVVGKALTLANIPFIAIDYNYHTVAAAKREGVNIIYGDPSDADVLDFAECEHALSLIVAVPLKFDQEAVIINAKKLNPKIFIISRVQNHRDHQRLKDLGVHTVVQPEMEASVSIIKRIFLLEHMPKEEIIKSLKHLKLIHGAV